MRALMLICYALAKRMQRADTLMLCYATLPLFCSHITLPLPRYDIQAAAATLLLLLFSPARADDAARRACRC